MVQVGRNPGDWKPMSTVGPGACEIRVRDEAGAFRVIYSPGSRMRCTFCMRFRKKRGRPPASTSIWQNSATGLRANSPKE